MVALWSLEPTCRLVGRDLRRNIGTVGSDPGVPTLAHLRVGGRVVLAHPVVAAVPTARHVTAAPASPARVAHAILALGDVVDLAVAVQTHQQAARLASSLGQRTQGGGES